MKRAAEWGEYMAVSAERLLDAINALDRAVEGEGTGPDEDAAIEYAEQALTEAMTGLRRDVYEFRKRAAGPGAISVLDYGADPSGATDSTRAFQAAADEAWRRQRTAALSARESQPAAAKVDDAMVERIIDRVSRENSIDGMDGDSWDRLLVRAAVRAAIKGDSPHG